MFSLTDFYRGAQRADGLIEVDGHPAHLVAGIDAGPRGEVAAGEGLGDVGDLAQAVTDLAGDGFDTTCQVNYLAPYALTRLLAPALNAAAGRIVTPAGALHSDTHLDNPGRRSARPVEAYMRAEPRGETDRRHVLLLESEIV